LSSLFFINTENRNKNALKLHYLINYHYFKEKSENPCKYAKNEISNSLKTIEKRHLYCYPMYVLRKIFLLS